MIPREAVRVCDMLDAVAIVETLLQPHEHDSSFSKVEFMALERAIEIISEASRHLSSEAKARHSSVPWRAIADIGNVLRHAYQDIDRTVILKIARSDLKALKPVLLAMQDAFDIR